MRLVDRLVESAIKDPSLQAKTDFSKSETLCLE